jgi:prepilin-type N-terminal cleavage/methylation domain-containing protein
MRTSHGFSLPELLIVTAILAYSLSVVLLTFINGTALNESSRNLITSVAHAEFVMEDIKNQAFTGLGTNISNGNWTWDTAAISSNGLTPMKAESIATTVSGTNPLDITVTVNWQDTRGRARSKSMRTLISG